MTTRPNRHAVEIVRDETWPPDADVAAYSWQCDCGDRGDPKYAADLYGQEVESDYADKRAKAAAEVASLDHTEYPHEQAAEIVNEVARDEDEWELSL